MGMELTPRRCPRCGAWVGAGQAFCSSCGERQAVPAYPPPPPAPWPSQPGPPPFPEPSPPSRRVSPWRLAAITVWVLGAAVAAFVLVRGFGRAEGRGPSARRAVEAAAAPTVTGWPADVTSPPGAGGSPSTPPATTTPVQSPSAGAAAATPEQAIARHVAGDPLTYVGDCGQVSDTGSVVYCSKLQEDRSATRIYMFGPAFSEPDTWLLLTSTEGGWAVTDVATFDPAGPPW